jgi:spermidine/putrescine transport system ATP-binding protein
VPTSRAQRHQGLVTVGVRPEKVGLHLEEPAATSERNVLGPGRVIDVSFAGVSTEYIVTVPGVGTLSVFAQNMGFGPVAAEGAEVWLSWDVEHGFGLEDEPDESSRFPADDDTRSIAVQRREALISELEGN